MHVLSCSTSMFPVLAELGSMEFKKIKIKWNHQVMPTPYDQIIKGDHPHRRPVAASASVSPLSTVSA